MMTPEQRRQVKTKRVHSVDVPSGRAKPFGRETRFLKKGTLFAEGCKPLECDIIMEKDFPIRMRDGITLYADVYRPATDEKVPAIISYAPYGKSGTGAWQYEVFPGYYGVHREELSGLQAFEGADPGFWCKEGYTIVELDARGAFYSEGTTFFMAGQEGQDLYDAIECLAVQHWCNGKVAMAGNSWLAISQWRAAETCPPHLAAIAPWEGLVDPYNEWLYLGGIPNKGMCGTIFDLFYGFGQAEDIVQMLEEHPYYDWFWEDKTVDTSKIQCPVYVVGSWSNTLHRLGTWHGWRNLTVKDKWFRVENTHEWADFYNEKYRLELLKFFDKFLKDLDNGWENTPQFRMSVLDPGEGHEDIVDRAEECFPPKGAEKKVLYLDAAKVSLSETKPEREDKTTFDPNSDAPYINFDYTFEKDTEVLGYPYLKLQFQVEGGDDADIFVQLQKLDKNGEQVFHYAVEGYPPYGGSSGMVRVSRRKLQGDPKEEEFLCNPPMVSCGKEEKLAPGELVEVIIPISPTATRYHAGETLRLQITSNNPNGTAVGSVHLEKTLEGNAYVMTSGGQYNSYLCFAEKPF